MRTLVIGGNGFIGRFLMPQLIDAGHDVTALQRVGSTAPLPDRVQVIRGDRRRLADRASALRAAAPDVVIDLILSSGRQATELVEVFSGHAGRVVAISSMDVYRAVGILHGSEQGPLEALPLHEDSAVRTKLQTYPLATVKALQQVFGWLDDEYDKIPVERVLMDYTGLPATILRLPMIYGPGDRLHRTFAFLKRMDDRRPVIVLPASVAAWRSPRSYVANVAMAIVAAADSPHAADRIYNVADTENYTELEWGRLIAAAAGWTGDFVVVRDEDAPPPVQIPGNLAQHWVVDTKRIRAELGYREPVARDEAIRRTVEWERAHPPAAEFVKVDYPAEDAAARSPGARRVPAP